MKCPHCGKKIDRKKTRKSKEAGMVCAYCGDIMIYIGNWWICRNCSSRERSNDKA